LLKVDHVITQINNQFWMQHKIALEIEIGILEERFMPSDTGHLHTTVAELKRRVLEIEKLLLFCPPP
tara:strand:+ start:258 stop:458 length:201 start_codon:yes stop_codon:yes gene_type:complete